jgi:hypothetical protein
VHLPVSVELSKAVPDPEIGAQDGVLQCLHGRIGHVFADDLKRAWYCFAPAGQHWLASRGKGRRIREDRLGAEQRRGDAPLPAPVVAFGDQQPLSAGAAEDIVLERALGEGVAVVQAKFCWVSSGSVTNTVSRPKSR